jgi:hypothetical protein
MSAITGSGRANPIINLPNCDFNLDKLLAEARNYAKEYADEVEHWHEDALLKRITQVLNTLDFQNNPKQYIKMLEKSDANKSEWPEKYAIAFLKKHFP